MRDTYLATDEAIAFGHESHTAVAVAQAIEAGCLDPDGDGSFTHPDLLRTLYGDGKVITPLYKNQRGGKVPRSKRKVRFDPDAGWHQEGGSPTMT